LLAFRFSSITTQMLTTNSWRRQKATDRRQQATHTQRRQDEDSEQ